MIDCQTHREAISVQKAAYYQAHREIIRAQQAAYYQANSGAAMAYRAAHRKAISIVKAAYYQANSGMVMARNAVRRARKMGSGGSFTNVEWQGLLNQTGHRCLACGAVGVPLTRDHVMPLSLGGSNWITNIQPLCNRCNDSKGTKSIDYR